MLGRLGLGARLQRDLVLEGERLAVVAEQLAALKAERDRLVAEGREATAVKARELARLGAIASESSFVFATELFGWRTFANRRQLAGSVGLTGTPYNSGQSAREQGISKAGNKRMRTMLVEIAWCWLRYQPASALSRWWRERFANTGGRARRIGIVALARKLLVALWRYLEHGIVPQGANSRGGPPHERDPASSPTSPAWRRARPRQGQVRRRRMALRASLDKVCARRRGSAVVGTEECPRRGSNKRMGLKE